MKELILLVGPPGSGKSTYAQQFLNLTHPCWYSNQDSQGKEGHLTRFKEGIALGQEIIIDRMNFSKEQRNRYLIPAKEAGYKTKIVVFHESFETCFDRCLKRENHETIKTLKDARNALGFFFKSYERVEDNEADEVVRIWPEGDKPKAIWVDIDGTIANCEHRKHFVQSSPKNWKKFFEEMINDSVNLPVNDVIKKFGEDHKIIFCSGRPDSYKKQTETWLNAAEIKYDHLFMRSRNDYRSDDIIKQILLDFEVLTRAQVLFCMDDRDQVVKMLRDRGLTVFQVAEGNF